MHSFIKYSLMLTRYQIWTIFTSITFSKAVVVIRLFINAFNSCRRITFIEYYNWTGWLASSSTNRTGSVNTQIRFIVILTTVSSAWFFLSIQQIGSMFLKKQINDVRTLERDGTSFFFRLRRQLKTSLVTASCYCVSIKANASHNDRDVKSDVQHVNLMFNM